MTRWSEDVEALLSITAQAARSIQRTVTNPKEQAVLEVLEAVCAAALDAPDATSYYVRLEQAFHRLQATAGV